MRPTRPSVKKTNPGLAVGLSLALCFGLGGCAAYPAGEAGLTGPEQSELARRERRLEASAQRVRDAGLDAYLHRLLTRLDPAGASVRIHVVDRPEPQAELLGGQVLVVRAGLLALVRDEDELAFVLAHELAHRTLEHVAARRRADWNAAAAELAADRRAAQALQRLGYRGSAGPDLLRRVFAATRDAEARALIASRIAALPSAASASPSGDDTEFESATARFRASGSAAKRD